MSDSDPILTGDDLHFDDDHPTIDSLEVHKLRRGRLLGQFQLHYQPVIDVRDGSLIGMEALLRWQHPDRGTLAAQNFLALAERSGLTGPIDGEVLRIATAFRQQLDIDESLDFKVTVNVVASDLTQPGVVEAVRKTLNETRLPARLLQLDVSNLAEADEHAALERVLKQLHGYGVSLSLDDFQAASATSQLDDLPFETVKVDFNEAHTPEEIQAMINAVSIARKRDLRVVAKRVETADHLRLLRTLEIQGAQGYALGPPVRATEFIGLLRDARLLPEEEPFEFAQADAA